ISSWRQRAFWANERNSASASYRRGSPLKSSTANSLPVNGSCTVFQAYGGRPDAANLRSVERGCEALSSLAAGRAGTAPGGNRPGVLRTVPRRDSGLESARRLGDHRRGHGGWTRDGKGRRGSALGFPSAERRARDRVQRSPLPKGWRLAGGGRVDVRRAQPAHGLPPGWVQASLRTGRDNESSYSLVRCRRPADVSDHPLDKRRRRGPQGSGRGAADRKSTRLNS